MNKIKNICVALYDQVPFIRFIKNLIKGHIFGLFSKYSHINKNGNPKVKYNTKTSAQRAATTMSEKKNVHFSNYKCIYCSGYHIGKNKENK